MSFSPVIRNKWIYCFHKLEIQIIRPQSIWIVWRNLRRGMEQSWTWLPEFFPHTESMIVTTLIGCDPLPAHGSSAKLSHWVKRRNNNDVYKQATVNHILCAYRVLKVAGNWSTWPPSNTSELWPSRVLEEALSCRTGINTRRDQGLLESARLIRKSADSWLSDHCFHVCLWTSRTKCQGQVARLQL